MLKNEQGILSGNANYNTAYVIGTEAYSPEKRVLNRVVFGDGFKKIRHLR